MGFTETFKLFRTLFQDPALNFKTLKINVYKTWYVKSVLLKMKD